MHDITFRTRLFLCFLAIIVMALVLPGLYVRNGIKEEGIDETVRSARREAQLIRMQMESVSDWGTEALGPLFGRMGRALGIRITFVSHTGAVLAESSPGLLSLNDFDNHADRMEIMIAKQEGFGFSIRHSNTLNTDLVYAALPFAATGSRTATCASPYRSATSRSASPPPSANGSPSWGWQRSLPSSSPMSSPRISNVPSRK